MSEMLSAVGEATGLKPHDVVIAHGLLQSAKMKTLSYCGTILETTTPEVRHLLTTQLNAALAGQERISNLVVSRGWYEAKAEPGDLLKQALSFAQPVLGG